MDNFLKYFQLVKVDIPQQIVYGLVTAEREDKDGEWCEYTSTKPEYEKVNEEMSKASEGQNIMPLREMHQLNAVGAGKTIEFDDAKKEIRMGFKVVDSSTWNKVLEKVLIGFSQGGRYLKRWTENGKNYYTAQPGEVSLVDNPALSGAVIEYVKVDGQVERFVTPSLARLSEGDVERISKALASQLNTQLQEFTAHVGNLVSKHSAVKGADMNKEQIEKCAKALGITVEEFTKQYIEGDALAKGAKGLAALHAHLKKAMSHHEKMAAHHGKMAEMHKAHGAMHDEHAEHLENCMKAHGALQDSAETEKILKALELEPPEMVSIGKTADGVEVFRKKAGKEIKLEALTAPPAADSIKKADVDAMIKAAVDKAVDDLKKSLPSGDNADKVFVVPRDENFKKAVAAAGSTPDPVFR